MINSDAAIIHNVFFNIIYNAIKYTDSGKVNVNISESGDKVVFNVKDTGIGIPQENLDHIFEPFRQGSEGLNRKYEGMGLGLTITKKYVELLKGKIIFDSEQGKGTEVTITLPKS